ncbi:MAG: S41 family peptidase [Pirellulales bacterium]
MPSWVSRTARAMLLAVLATLASPALSLAQVEFGPAGVSQEQLDEILQRGQALERDRRWGEALTHYEEALRQHPNDSRLEQRFTSSKLHYDLARRYSDQSFTRSLSGLSEGDALSLYSEVLLKIHSHYVEQPSWRHLVDRGTQGLEIALADPVFADRYLRNANPAAVKRFRDELYRTLRALPMNDRHQARNAVAQIGTLGRQRLGIPATSIILEYVCGATNALDDFSAFLTGDQLSETYSQIDGNFVGLGIELKSSDGALLIVKVIPGSPAEKSGLAGGDAIVAVSGRSTADMSTDEAANLLQGEEGSTVELQIRSPQGQDYRVTVRRAHVEIPSITDEAILDRDRGIAYLKLTCFQKTTARDLDAALWRLHRQGMKQLIMDLRGNPGGLLTSSVEVADKFVDQGTIVATRGRNPHEDFTYAAHRAGTWKLPLVVLIDGDSASASEIFAGAIRDHRRGTIVGMRSYGKGSVQGIFPLNLARSGLRLTTAKFYSPKGHPYSKVGVEPDVQVHRVAKPVEDTNFQPPADENDLALDEALRVARAQIARR